MGILIQRATSQEAPTPTRNEVGELRVRARMIDGEISLILRRTNKKGEDCSMLVKEDEIEKLHAAIEERRKLHERVLKLEQELERKEN